MYQMAARLFDLQLILKSEGIRTHRTLQRLAVCPRKGGQVAINLKRLSRPIVIRPATSGVPSIIIYHIREEYGQFDLKRAPKLIVDAEVCIGDTLAYFLSPFSNAKVIALELNHESFDQADLNMHPNGIGPL
jgi:hypothetical protein